MLTRRTVYPLDSASHPIHDSPHISEHSPLKAERARYEALSSLIGSKGEYFGITTET